MWEVCASNPTSTETGMWGKQPAAMLAIYTGRGVAPEVNLRERVTCTSPPSVNKSSNSGFETQRRRYQKIQNICPPIIC